MREGAAGVYDPVGGRLLAFGGWDGTQVRNDFWALSLSGPLAWQSIATPEVPAIRSGSGAVYDPDRDRLVLFGGNNAQALNDTWVFLPGPRPILHEDDDVSEIATTVPPVSEWAIAGVRPNPSRSLVTFGLVSGSGPARASVFDASGRVVREWNDLRAQSAEHAVIWDGRAGDGRGVADGVYFLRLESGGSVSTSKFIRMSK
jgi:hypothetical protein